MSSPQPAAIAAPASPDHPALIKRFERDIVYDSHGTIISYCRSKAGEELLKDGKESLLALAVGLRRSSENTWTSVPEGLKEKLRCAYWMLCNDFAKTLSLSSPVPDSSFEALGAWAKAHS